ncbi:nucleotide-binding protein [Paenibacillus sp. 481]|uniref:nucleotide-binding protein n=1 Tax=Paenibacillus sp. 481 TaxID=2835869 RepID=UPI001E5C3779|nr:nucleotide-binding protein [Paenibacillus sp. 481]
MGGWKNNVVACKININTFGGSFIDMVEIFVGSANTPNALDDLREIAELIEEVGHVVLPWNSPGVFLLGNHMSESLESICKRVDAAILIFSEDNYVMFDNEFSWHPKPNVLYEYGLFKGHLGADRTIICRRGSSSIPSDLDGVIYCNLDKSHRAKRELLAWLRLLSPRK